MPTVAESLATNLEKYGPEATNGAIQKAFGIDLKTLQSLGPDYLNLDKAGLQEHLSKVQFSKPGVFGMPGFPYEKKSEPSYVDPNFEGPPAPEGSTFEPPLPKEKSYRPLAGLAKYAGVIAGAPENLKEGIPNFLEDLAHRPAPGLEKSGVTKAYRQIRKETEENNANLDLSSPASIYDTYKKDLADVTAGIAKLLIVDPLSEVVGYTDADKSFLQHAKDKFWEGYEKTGPELAAGAVGQTAAVARHPVETFTAKPFTTALIVTPLVEGLLKSANPVVRAAAEKLTTTKAYQNIAEAIPEALAKQGKSATEANFAEATPGLYKRAKAGIDRFVSDSMESAVPRDKPIQEGLIKDPQHTEALVKGTFQHTRPNLQARSAGTAPKTLGEEFPRYRDSPQVPGNVEVLTPENPTLKYHPGVKDFVGEKNTPAWQNYLKESTRPDLDQYGRQTLLEDTLQNLVPTSREAKAGYVEVARETAEAASKVTDPAAVRAIIEKHFEIPEDPVRTYTRYDVKDDPGFTALVDNLQRNIPDSVARNSKLDPVQLRGWVVESLSEESVAALVDKKVRARVIRSLAKENPEVFRGINKAELRALDSGLERAAQSVLDPSAERAQLPTFDLGRGHKPITPADYTRHAASATGPLQRSYVWGEIGERAATKAHKETLANGLWEEAMPDTRNLVSEETDSFNPTVNDKGHPVDAPQTPLGVAEYLMGHVAEQGRLPSLIAADIPATIRAIQSNGNYLTARLDIKPESITRVVDQLRRYQKPSRGLKAVMEDHPSWQHYGPNLRVSPDLNGSVGVHLDVMAALEDTGKWGWRKVQNYIKRSLTGRSPSSGVNNLTANVVIYALSTGDVLTPLRLIKTTTDYIDFVQGGTGLHVGPLKVSRAIAPETARIFRAIQASGLIDTNLLKAEVGKIAGWKVNRALETTYNFGDTLFKLQDSVQRFKSIENDLSHLNPGEVVTLRVTNRRSARLLRTEDGWAVESAWEGKAGTPKGGQVWHNLTPEKFDRLKALTAGKRALDLYMDMGDTPNIVKRIRAAPLIGLASPFMVWAYKAMDIPGFKKGMVANTLADMPMVESTNPVIFAKNVARGIRTSFQRSLLLGAAKSQLEENPEWLRRILAYSPKGAGTTLFYAFGNNSVRYKDLNAANSFLPTDTMLRGLLLAGETIGEITGLIGDEDQRQAMESKAALMADDSVPWEFKRRAMASRTLWEMDQQGELYDLEDLFKQVGLAGSPLTDILALAGEGGKHGKQIAANRLIQTLGSAFAGGAWWKTFETVVPALQAGAEVFADRLAAKPTYEAQGRETNPLAFNLGEETDKKILRSDTWSVLSSRQLAQRPTDQAEMDYLQWFTSRMIGFGWKVAMFHHPTMGKADIFFKQMETEILGATSKKLEKRAKELFDLGGEKDAEALMTKAKIWETTVKSYVKAARAEAFKMAELTGILKE